MNHPPDVWIRPAQESDADAFFELIRQSSHGITSLPLIRESLTQQLVESNHSFLNNPTPTEGFRYLFVLENGDPNLSGQNKILGCAAIRSCGSERVPFYHFKILKEQHFCPILKRDKTHDLLVLCNDYQYATEVSSLFMLPSVRSLKLGQLLSRSRFLFLKLFSDFFNPLVVAEMRGVINPSGESVFWNALAGRFIEMPFLEADRLTGTGEKNFIATLMPRYPIYTVFLPLEVRQIIGQVHPETAPAFSFLKREGFCFKNYIDLFDGGPNIECQLPHIFTVRTALALTVLGFAHSFPDPSWHVLSNLKMDFRATASPVHIMPEGVWLSERAFNRLGLKVGDQVQCAPYFPR